MDACCWSEWGPAGLWADLRDLALFYYAAELAMALHASAAALDGAKEEPRNPWKHLVKHPLTEEVQRAAALEFAAEDLTPEQRGHAVWKLQQRELRAAFVRVYGTHTASCNNSWLRGKLLQALGLDPHWMPEGMQPRTRESKPLAAELAAAALAAADAGRPRRATAGVKRYFVDESSDLTSASEPSGAHSSSSGSPTGPASMSPSGSPRRRRPAHHMHHACATPGSQRGPAASSSNNVAATTTAGGAGGSVSPPALKRRLSDGGSYGAASPAAVLEHPTVSDLAGDGSGGSGPPSPPPVTSHHGGLLGLDGGFGLGPGEGMGGSPHSWAAAARAAAAELHHLTMIPPHPHQPLSPHQHLPAAFWHGEAAHLAAQESGLLRSGSAHESVYSAAAAGLGPAPPLPRSSSMAAGQHAQHAQQALHLQLAAQQAQHAAQHQPGSPWAPPPAPASHLPPPPHASAHWQQHLAGMPGGGSSLLLMDPLQGSGPVSPAAHGSVPMPHSPAGLTTPQLEHPPHQPLNRHGSGLEYEPSAAAAAAAGAASPGFGAASLTALQEQELIFQQRRQQVAAELEAAERHHKLLQQQAALLAQQRAALGAQLAAGDAAAAAAAAHHASMPLAPAAQPAEQMALQPQGGGQYRGFGMPPLRHSCPSPFAAARAAAMLNNGAGAGSGSPTGNGLASPHALPPHSLLLLSAPSPPPLVPAGGLHSQRSAPSLLQLPASPAGAMPPPPPQATPGKHLAGGHGHPPLHHMLLDESSDDLVSLYDSWRDGLLASPHLDHHHSC